MRGFKEFLQVILILTIHCLISHGVNTTTINDGSVSKNNNFEQTSKVGWIFHDESSLRRTKRNVIQNSVNNKQEKNHNLFDDPFCRDDLRRLCGNTDSHNDDMQLWECLQTLKPNEIATIDSKCQHSIFKHMMNISDNDNIKKQAKQVCGDELENLNCPSNIPGSFLSCLIEKREQIRGVHCLDFIQRWEWLAFSDFRIIAPFLSDCQHDIEEFQCGRIQSSKDIAQGEILACLQQHADKLENICRKRIFLISEIQSGNINLDRQLHIACVREQMQLCPQVRPGSGQVIKCLMQHKMHRTMSKACQEQLIRREQLMVLDYKVSKGLVKACREDIKQNHCRRSVSNDREIKLAQILLCLESAEKNGSKISQDCKAEIFDHRKMLMNDYRLSPEIVDRCSTDISTFCSGLEVGGKTIHCLMDNARYKNNRLRISSECQRALETLVKEADIGEDWRIDPVLREACQPVVSMACGNNIQGGNARVISCLMENLGTGRMTEPCEAALIQIQYFVARDYKLDPQLYRACKSDAIHFCHAKSAWSSDGIEMDPERGPLVLPCLHRYANHPQKNMTLKRKCTEEIKRVMRQRAMNVDLLPEIEDVCLNDLAGLCYDKTGRGEEILCLQDNFENLKSVKCKDAVSNFTEEQAEQVELNPLIMNACSRIIEHYCQDIFKRGRDEGDMMECLIEHKNDLETTDYKCKAAVEHFQLISLKSYHFTYKLNEACRSYVLRYCRKARTSADVIECLSSIIQEDVMKENQPRIKKNCRQQLKAQLYQQRENIHFDPILQKACETDIQNLCHNVVPGNSRILECLATQKSHLSMDCRKQLFKVRKQEFEDSSIDYALLNNCHSMVAQFCHTGDRTQILDCLKRYKDDSTFDEKCKNFVIQRMIEQNTDYRFNTALQSSCSSDINKHCKEVLKNEPMDRELEGKVIRCLKIKFRESKLSMKCEHQMTNVLREAALNYHLNPLLATLCANEIDTICGAEENEPGSVEECLKKEFNADNKLMREECRMQVADLIEEARADIHVDPLLQTACAVDVTKYCSDVPQGAGRHITCLQNVLQDSKKSLQPDCFKMLTMRMEMFRSAAKAIAPNSIEELYDSVNRSPARRYFIIVALSMIGMIFVSGLFCGRLTRRSMMMMKNK